MDAQKTGDYLAMLRKAKGLTQQEVGEKLGVSNKTISKWESGGGFPDISALPALAELYGVTADEILAGAARDRAEPAQGPSEVGRYLARRGELRFRLGWAAAALCLLAGMIYRYQAFLPLLLAGAALALWVGWGPCEKERLPGRFRMVLSLAAVAVYLFLWAFGPWNALDDWLRAMQSWSFMEPTMWAQRRLAWTGRLLLLPVVYALLRRVLRGWSGEEHLLPPPCFRALAAGWGACLCLDIARWVVEGAKFRAFLAAMPAIEEGQTSISSYLLDPAKEAMHLLMRAAATGQEIAFALLLLAAAAVLWVCLRRTRREKTGR